MDEVEKIGGKNAPAEWRADPSAPAGRPPESIPGDQARIKELDGLRGLAALAIVIFHAQPDWLPLGWVGVDLFFGLSGFLITSIVLKHGQSAGFLRQFYLRRGLRIWPIYYLTILCFIVLAHHLPQRCDWSGFWYDFTYTQDVPLYWSSSAPGFHGYLKHTWSLAIEEQFYLIWPVVVLLCGVRRLPILASGCVVISVMGRCLGWPASLLLTRMDGLVLGGMLAALLHRELVSRTRAGWLFGSLVALGASATVLLAAMLHLSCKTLAVSGAGLLAINLAGMGVIGIVVTRANAAWLAPLRWGVLTYLGKISYGLYLYHYVILRISAGRLRLWAPWEMPVGRQALTILLCFLAASLSWAFIEQPILRLKRRFEYEGRRQGEPTGSSDQGESPRRFQYHGMDSPAVPTPAGPALWRLHPGQKDEGTEAHASKC
jgi:peptidoglycan/LPS O-acetylase OafA/YrhL